MSLKLTSAEETALCEWCHQYIAWGFPPRVDMLRQMANIVLESRALLNGPTAASRVRGNITKVGIH